MYKLCGSINEQLAEKAGFSEEDAEVLKEALCILFENDTSSARLEGSIEVNKVYWVEHKSKAGDVSSVVVHISFMTEVEDGKLNRFECYKAMEPELEGFDKMEVNNLLTVYKAR